MENIKELMKRSKGKSISVIFTKKDGSSRIMNCETGVQKNQDFQTTGLFLLFLVILLQKILMSLWL